MKLGKSVKNQKGFTLVELIVSIAILGILAAIAIPRFSDQTTKANTAKIASDLSAIDTAITVSIADGHTPSVTTDATAGTTTSNLVSDGYLAAWPSPPTGSAYLKTVSKPISGTSYGIDSNRAIFNNGTDATTTHAEDWHK